MRDDVNVALIPSGATQTAPSVVACAALCARKVMTCYSFMYNETSRQCTPGLRLINSDTRLDTNVLGNLYYIPGTYCDTTKANYVLNTNGTVSTCILMVRTLNYYGPAKNSCRDLGGNLYTMKVPEKFFLALDSVKKAPDDYWIGLDDLDVEGVYRWADDNSVFNNSWNLFAYGTPNQIGDEDCIQIRPYFEYLNDYFCQTWHPYICEIRPLVL
ncbi:Low affinity immunoglobulin epsilon Fc receptor [Bulinus truncatus]|nr:Low affinity immunoglobulin epsilon Fc receptor [Bulinus truncatus]